jgi:putative endonuclease
MFYVYLIKSPKTGQIYTGFTENLKRRFAEHQQLQRHKGWKLIYYEAHLNREDAVERERKLKSYGSSLQKLKTRLKRSLNLQDLE